MRIDKSAGFSLPFTMSDWALIIGALRSRIADLKRIPESNASENEIADAYTDLEGLEGILRQITSEFEKRYGGLPS
jgi:hypothetical protein